MIMFKQTKDESYNGWTNHATWAAYVLLSNDEYIYTILRRSVRTKDLEEFSNISIGYIEASDEHNINVNDINWDELFEAFEE